MIDEDAQIIIETTDGHRWPVHGEGSYGRSLRLMEGSLGEFYSTPKATTYKSRTGAGGSAFLGSRDLARRWTLRVDTFGPDWDRDMSRFLRGLSTDEDAKVIYRTARWGERVLRFRMEEGSAYRRPLSPGALASASYEIPVISGMPYWCEQVLHTDDWEFTGEGFIGELEVDNPGTVEAWPEFVLTSPAAWIVPDVDLRNRQGEDRMVPLRFQPHGRDVHIMTSPVQETSVSTDDTLDHWMGGGPLHFLNPIPPLTEKTTIPVAVDPLPALELTLPPGWKQWIAERLHQFLRDIGVDPFMQMTPEQVGNMIAGWIRDATPSWLPTIGDGLLAELTGAVFARAIRDHYGTFGNVRGVTAQIILERRYDAPWG